MKKLIFLLAILVACVAGKLPAQTIEITFTGDNNGQAVALDSVLTRNHTQGAEVMIYPPDLKLILVITGMEESATEQNPVFSLTQNYPNPFNNQTSFQIQMYENAPVEISVSNILGQTILSHSQKLDRGNHSLTFKGGNQSSYFLTARCKGLSETIKMISNPSGSKQHPVLIYSGNSQSQQLKSVPLSGELPFEPGDEILMVGYADGQESGCAESPGYSHECKFQFATNIACPGAETVEYMGQTYNTIQVFGQCWFKENLNAGEMITSSNPQINNDTIEKYCMGDMTSYCDIVGGLYFWDEMMQYTTQNGGRGICPESWHVPTDLDWRILTGAADSEFPIGHFLWGVNSWRGTDAGGNLKQTGTEYWVSPNTGATDQYGFTALPAGYFVQGDFWGPGYKTFWWSSDPDEMYYHHVDWEHATMKRSPGGDEAAFSVRCIKN